MRPANTGEGHPAHPTEIPTGARLRPLAWAALLVALPLGCELPEIDEADPTDVCLVTEGDAQLAGQWTLTASGTRSACIDDGYDGDFSLGTSQELHVVQATNDANEELGLEGPLLFSGGSFDLNGSVRGVCVDFSTTETGPSGHVVYRFTGTVSDSGMIRGTFTGDGPSQCATEGTFSVAIR